MVSGTSRPSAIKPEELKNSQEKGSDINWCNLVIGSIVFGISCAITRFILKPLFKGSTDSVSSSKASSPLPMFVYTPKMASSGVQRLSDVCGIDEITEEITNLVNMIKSPEKYISKGAKVPKGLLLYGKPGTGKTMLARAIAGEAGVTFFYCTGSEFDEMFVGVGASRIRELFAQAKRHKPCIIFIDEIDTLFSHLGNTRHLP